MRTLLIIVFMLIACSLTTACSSAEPAETMGAVSEAPNADLAVQAATPTATAPPVAQAAPTPAVLPTDTPAPTAPPVEPAAAQPAADAAANTAFLSEGQAARISDTFQGELMANGEPYNKDALVAAHKELPLGTVVRVTNMDTGLVVDVTVVDRISAAAQEVIDVSRAAAVALGMPDMGTAFVQLELVQ
ncbi:MAG: septal ring lytic transglycosylase RlpA family protein [Caldilineaceae bacterium]